MPYDHKNTTPDGAPSHLMRSVLENLNHRNFQDSCLVGSGGGAVGYVTSHKLLKLCESKRVIMLSLQRRKCTNAFLFHHLLGTLHMGLRLIICMTLRRCQCLSHLRYVNLLSLLRLL